jgi:hypothetical protein
MLVTIIAGHPMKITPIIHAIQEARNGKSINFRLIHRSKIKNVWRF